MTELRETLRDCTRALQGLLTAVDSDADAESTLRLSERCRDRFAALAAKLPEAPAAARSDVEAELEQLRRFTTLVLDASLRGKTRTGDRLCAARRASRVIAASRGASGGECDVAG